MFVAAVALLLVCVFAILSVPVWRRNADPIPMGPEADQDQDRVDLTIERETLARSLHELEVEHGQGRLAEVDFARLKATDERRLLQVLDRLEMPGQSASAAPAQPAGRRGEPVVATRSWVAAVAPAVVVLIASSSLYAYIQWKQMQAFAATQTRGGGGPGMPDPRQMVERLEARLRANPDDLQGQIMAGRSYTALQRMPEAKQAWTKVLELDPRNNEAHYSLGVLLIEMRKFDDPELFKAALAHFDAALVNVPMEPGVNWYRGLALWYLKHYSETDAAWTIAAQNLPPGSEDAEFVKTALMKLRAGQAPF
jgi:cytochrome c-type biogenesis protein CcmH